MIELFLFITVIVFIISVIIGVWTDQEGYTSISDACMFICIICVGLELILSGVLLYRVLY